MKNKEKRCTNHGGRVSIERQGYSRTKSLGGLETLPLGFQRVQTTLGQAIYLGGADLTGNLNVEKNVWDERYYEIAVDRMVLLYLVWFADMQWGGCWMKFLLYRMIGAVSSVRFYSTLFDDF